MFNRWRMIYPIFVSVFLLESRPRFRVAGTAPLFLFSMFAHAFLETPVDQYLGRTGVTSPATWGCTTCSARIPSFWTSAR